MSMPLHEMQSLMTAWTAACGSAGAVTMLLSPGTYYIGPVQFHGPCNASTLTFQLQASRPALALLIGSCQSITN
jgi:galacturan 1,4-alpha-galacturonidase